jgi:hypothetical protein
MFLSNSARPAAREVVLQRFRFSYTVEGIKDDSFHEIHYAVGNLRILNKPIA